MLYDEFVNSIKVLSNTQFGFRESLGTTNDLLLLTHDQQSSLDNPAELRIVFLDFSSAFNSFNHQRLLNKLKSIGDDGPVFNIFNGFLTNFQQCVSVDGNYSQLKCVVSGVHQGSVLGPLLFVLYTADMWNDLENKIILYADDTILYAEAASPYDHINVANSLSRDLFNHGVQCGE